MKKVTKAVFVDGRSLRSLNIAALMLASDEDRLDDLSRVETLWNGEVL